MIKSTSYFILKPFRSQGIKIFIVNFWSYRETANFKTVNFKIHDVTTWKTKINNMSRNKGNQTMKCGQLI